MGTNFLIGIRTDNFVILASDTDAYLHGAIKMAHDQQKDYKLGERLWIVCMGEGGDTDSFATWAKANIDLYSRRNSYELRPKEAHHWLRKSMAENLRSEDMWRVNAILGGFDPFEKKAYLTYIDYYASQVPCQNFVFSGFSGNFAYAIADNLYRPDMTVDDGLGIVSKVIQEVKRRVIINFDEYRAVVIDVNGSRVVEGIRP